MLFIDSDSTGNDRIIPIECPLLPHLILNVVKQTLAYASRPIRFSDAQDAPPHSGFGLHACCVESTVGMSGSVYVIWIKLFGIGRLVFSCKRVSSCINVCVVYS